MKKIIITLMLLPILSFSQECYTVTEVSTQIKMEEISKNRIIFGIKQIMEDVISDKYELCMDGKPVKVVVQSIEAPQTGIELGPWTKVSKKTIVTLLLYIDGKEIENYNIQIDSIEAGQRPYQNRGEDYANLKN